MVKIDDECTGVDSCSFKFNIKVISHVLCDEYTSSYRTRTGKSELKRTEDLVADRIILK
jgi:hypothetical protein